MKKMSAVPLSKQVAKTQRVFNTYIRKRDKDKGCVSCKSPKVEHASHYFSAGKYPALRFHEDNVHGSCLRCNYFMAGNLIEYRKTLVKRIGNERLELLEGQANRKVHKWSVLELQTIEQEYKQKIKNEY
jgi:hypothetical protein